MGIKRESLCEVLSTLPGKEKLSKSDNLCKFSTFDLNHFCHY